MHGVCVVGACSPVRASVMLNLGVRQTLHSERLAQFTLPHLQKQTQVYTVKPLNNGHHSGVCPILEVKKYYHYIG